MDSFSLAGITLLVVLVAMFAVAVVSYMSSLVKNAYEIKIEMRAELEDGLRRLTDDDEKRTRAAKRELLDEVAKGRVILENENTRHFSELAEASKKQLTDLEEAARRDRTKAAQSYEEMRVRLDDLRARVGELEHIYRAIARPRALDREKEKGRDKDRDRAGEAFPTSDLDPTKSQPKTDDLPSEGKKPTAASAGAPIPGA